MKKISIIALSVLFLSASVATAVPLSSMANLKTYTPTVLTLSETFTGALKLRQNGTAIGTINGTYQTRNNRSGQFQGEWTVQQQNHSAAGTMMGRFRRPFFIGRITVEGQNITMPIIGFIFYRNETFFGRVMALRGPPLYFMGTFT